MSSFSCLCGYVVRHSDEPPGSSGVLYSLDSLRRVESAIGNEVASLIAAGSGRAQWLASRFGDRYPSDIADCEIVEDLVARELNASFTAVFRCPRCHRIALGPEGAEVGWRFYSRE